MRDTPTSDVIESFAAIKECADNRSNILYPDRPTEVLIEWIWAFTAGPLVLLLLLDTLRVLVEPAYAQYWGSSLQDPIFTTTVLTALIGGLAFRYLVKKTPEVFLTLAASGRLVSGAEDGASEWAKFGVKLASRIRSRKHWLNVALWIIGIGCYVGLVAIRRPRIFAAIGAGFASDPGFPVNLLDSLSLAIQFVLTPLLWAFIAARITSIMGVIGEAIRNLTPAFDLDILPDDPDNCGGFRQLGDICFNLALPILVCVLYAGIWSFVLTATQSPSETRPFMLLGIPVLVFLAFATFFWPMWDVHQDMVAQRARYQADVERQMTEAEHVLQAYLQQSKPASAKKTSPVKPDANSDKQLAAITARLKALRELSPAVRNYPTWPFDRRIFLTFISPNLASIFALFLGLTKDQSETLKQLLQFINPQ